MPDGSVVPVDPFVPELELPRGASAIIVRLRYDYSALKSDDLYADDELTEQLGSLRALLDDVDRPSVARAIRNTSASTLWELESSARSMHTEFETPGEGWRSLTRYWRIDLRDRPERVEALLERLRALGDAVELAYAEGTLVDAGQVAFTDDPLASGGNATPATWQRYQDASPVGVDARYAWDFASGAGVGLVDLEQQWFKTHEDLDAVDPVTLAVTPFETVAPLLYGVNAVDTGLSGYSGSHGASVWGVVFGRDNRLGVVGLAPGLDRPARVSHMVPLAAGGFEINHFAEALLEALRGHLQPGDVLLIESQVVPGTLLDGGPAAVQITSPVEVQALERDAIQLAVSLGVIVIEPAGNGASNLDDVALFWGGAFVEGEAAFEDSGAILVGASTPPDHGSRLLIGNTGSNFGSRVNCFAWGAEVWTAGRNGVDPDQRAYGTFSGTSAAAAIIAGVAVLVQSYYRAQTGSVLSPLQMRALLSDPANGLDRSNLGLGVMPDLRRVLPALGLQADVYLRDNLGDTGVAPSTGTLSSSPDIIVRRAPVADPDATFGEASPNRDRVDLAEEVAAGQDHHVYVRVMNRGAGAATGATATVYWSPPATLVTPDLWTKIGTTNRMNVPVGGALTVSDALVWRAQDVPGPGHYCFVALLDDPSDPAPPVPPTGGPLAPTWADYLAFVRNNNNVAWRNFNVVTSLGSFLGRVGQLPFWVVGAPGEDLSFDLELLQRLPHGSRVWLHLDPQMRPHWWATKSWFPLAFKFGQWLPVSTDGRVELGSFRLAAGARFACRIAVFLPNSKASLGARIAVRQLYKREEVGRVTWQFGAAAV